MQRVLLKTEARRKKCIMKFHATWVALILLSTVFCLCFIQSSGTSAIRGMVPHCKSVSSHCVEWDRIAVHCCDTIRQNRKTHCLAFMCVFMFLCALQMTVMWFPAISAGKARSMDCCPSSRTYRTLFYHSV